ncbi:hypothetical protein QTI24_30190 [Variovorax sp. J22P240]|uniref:hypothetical protein n=1 Tax=Variovorax sp. J22P240 TaxID=3053514 RepID=UPI0025789E4A|nr:hypothetical protein [Variovorax sp. J22P240]MDM0002894.1 hypothetical protein [Variovorax sp. J22P240]
MEAIQEQHERAVGESLIAWLNERDGTSYSFLCRGDEAPDLIYGFDGRTLGIEVVGAYYDKEDSKMQWQGARRHPEAPKRWSGINFDDRLLGSIEKRIAAKCAKNYGSDVILLVAVRPALTAIPDMEALLRRLDLPNNIPFTAVYVGGDFPTSSYAQGGYKAWQVHPARTPPD